MLEVGDLGFSSFVVVALVCVLFQVVIGLICRKQWRQTAAREEEIRRLLALASEEDARAELEALSGYSYRYEVGVGVTDSVSPATHQCAVCYSPTTTRCKQCKAVRYCSGKCQIIHWRQGHKNECHPPEAGTDFGQRVAEVEQNISYDHRNENEGREFSKVSAAFSGKPVPVDSRFAAKVHGLKDGIEQNLKAENSFNESSVAASSGFSECGGCIELSDDDDSSCGSNTSNDSEKSDEHLSNHRKYDNVGPNSADHNMLQAERVSPKFASLVNSVGSFSSLNYLEPRFDDSKGHYQSTPSGLSNNVVQNGLPGEQSTSSSGFWEDALDSVKPRNSVHVGTKEESIFHDIHPAKEVGDATTMLDKVEPKVSTTLRSPSLKVEGNGKRDDSYNNVSDLLTSTEARSSVSMQANMSSSASSDSASRYSYDSGAALSSSSKRSNGTADVAPAPIKEKLKGSKLLSLSNPSSVLAYANEEEHSLPQRITTKKPDEVQATRSLSSVAAGSAKRMNSLPTFSERAGDQLKGSMLSKHQSLGGMSDISKIYTYKGLFSYEFFVKLYTWKYVALHPCGLINCGNSCYANAVLQCLAFTPPLTAYFLQGLHSKSCAKRDWCFMCEFESLILKAKEGNSPISPIAIVSQLRNLGIQLDSGKEEDAHEFLRYAIDAMQSVCCMESCEAKFDSSAEETTLIGLTFGGYLQSKIRCTKCQEKSERHERMMDMTVEIEGDVGTLEGALRQFTESEILDGENKYQCLRCKSYEKAKKKLTILEAPNVLTIALKRFQSGKFGKLTKSIRFPEILNLAPYMSGTSDKSPIYRLYGVIVHLDVMNGAFSGHYVCYVKNPQNKWFKIDDSTVTPVELARVLAAEAYMLLYARCSPRAPRSMRNSKISSDPRQKGVSIRSVENIASLNNRSRAASLGDLYHNSTSFDTPGNVDNFYLQFHRIQKILGEDSSDSSSLFSSNSDEGSCSTDSTRDSSSADDLSDYTSGDGVRGWNSSLKGSSDSDTSSSSSSPSYPGKAQMTKLGPLASDLSGACRSQTDCEDPMCRDYRPDTLVNTEGARSFTVLHSDMTKQCRKLDSRSSCRETDSERLASANGLGDVKSLSFRKSARKEQIE